MKAWVERLAESPWQAPSVPFPELSVQPVYEVRIAEVPEAGGVEVFYRHVYDGDVVDLIWVGSVERAAPTEFSAQARHRC